MASIRTLRPLARALQRPIARPSYASFSVKSSRIIAPFTPSISSQLQSRTKQQIAVPTAAKLPTPTTKLNVLQAAMPQLVPFFWVNEVVTLWILFPLYVYIMSKYILPQEVRVRAARFFITKL